MGDLAQNLIFGFSVAVTPQNLLFCLIGALLGTLVGVLPGLGPVATIAMLLPVTFTLPPVAALIMLAGLYYGAQYGGSTTAILVNIPGESSSVVTTIDGHAMARKGRAGSALAIAALGSFFAGCVATAIVAVFSQPLVRVAGSFQSPDYFGLLVFGMVAAVVLAQGSVVRSVGMVVLGLFLGLIGTDIASGQTRFTLRHLGARRRRRLRAGGHGLVRHRRGDRQPGARRCTSADHRKDQPPLADARGSPASLAGGAARHRHRLAARRAAGGRCS